MTLRNPNWYFSLSFSHFLILLVFLLVPLWDPLTLWLVGLPAILIYMESTIAKSGTAKTTVSIPHTCPPEVHEGREPERWEQGQDSEWRDSGRYATLEPVLRPCSPSPCPESSRRQSPGPRSKRADLQPPEGFGPDELEDWELKNLPIQDSARHWHGGHCGVRSLSGLWLS